MKMNKQRVLGFLFCLFLSSYALAGVQAILIDSLDSSAGKTTISTEGGLLKFEQVDKQEHTQMIFNKNKKEMLVVDHQAKTFTRIDQAFISRVSKQIEMVKKQIESIPPEQREMMKKMMGGNLAGLMQDDTDKKSIYKKTARKQTVANHACSVVEKYRQGVKQLEFCVADTGKLAGEKELLSITREMTSLFETLVQSMPGAYSDNPFEDLKSLDGFPLVVSEFENGELVSRLQLESMQQKSFSADFFKLPQGYKEQNAMPMGMGGL